MEAVLQILAKTDDGLSAREIYEALSKSIVGGKAEVNRILYKELLPQGLVTVDSKTTPPRWSKTRPAPAQSQNMEEKNTKMIVMIDLGNVHDCLSHVKPYAKRNKEADNVSVVAFADYGYKVSPEAEEAGYDVEVLQIKEPPTCTGKNAADVLLMFTCFELCMAAAEGQHLHFIIATKDEGYRYLATIVHQHYGHQVTFVRDWNELRIFIE